VQAVEGAQVLAENTALVGIRKVKGVLAIRDRLKERGEPHAVADILAFFKTVKFADEPLSKKIVETYLRIHVRVASAFDAMDVLLLMESLLGPRHVLSYWTSIDLVVRISN
jgi:hypothetical protein